MKTIKILTPLLMVIAISLASCEKWLDINKDPDSPSDAAVTENVMLPGILVQINYELTGGYPARIPNYWMGQYNNNAQSPDDCTFDIDESDVNNTWTYTVYTSALKNSRKLMDMAEANKNYYYLGISQVMSAYVLSVMTDLYGDIPWSQAFDFNTHQFPVFDTQEQIYTTVFDLLEDAIANFNLPTAGQALRPADDDLVYYGDVGKWRKLAYTLKARYAMRLTYAPGKVGMGQADSALAALANGFRSSLDNAGIVYDVKSGSEAPWFQWDVKWDETYASDFIVNMMNAKFDPRRPMYFTQNDSGDFRGNRSGHLMLGSELDSVSYLSDVITAADQSCFFVTYDEALFIKAEAYLWKGDMTNAKLALDEAIRENMGRIGVVDSNITAYIDSLAPMPSNFEDAQKMIIEEKYVANFLSIEIWNDYRRTGYPVISLADFEDPTYSSIPLRFMYPSDVRLNNPDNMPVVNWLTDKLWWDGK